MQTFQQEPANDIQLGLQNSAHLGVNDHKQTVGDEGREVEDGLDVDSCHWLRPDQGGDLVLHVNVEGSGDGAGTHSHDGSRCKLLQLDAVLLLCVGGGAEK